MTDYIAAMATDMMDDDVLNPGWPGNMRNINSITKIVVHHEGQNYIYVYEDLSRYQAEARYQNGVSIPGSVGLQYHFKIDNVGTINQVRPLNMTLWHCGDLVANWASIAICLDGNFETQQPTREQFEALKQLLDWLCTQHPEFPAVESDVWPHRHFFNTYCPGRNLVGFVDAYRNNEGNIAIPDVPYQHPELQPSDPQPTNDPAPETPAPASPTPESPQPVPVEPTPVPVTPSDPSTPAEPQPPLTTSHVNIIMEIVSEFAKYNKTIVGILGAAVTVATVILGPDNHILLLIVQILTVLGIYATPNANK